MFSIGEVQAHRKLLAPSFPGFGNIPTFQAPPGIDWPEYRLPSFLRPNYPPIPSGFYRYTPPATTTATTTQTSSKP
ncbi:unnamed protein product [Sphenostylis stenocarpa]|uniref:Uncharacterized protein n=1 Tax=Sphenostylis stenocarpa TaxID=92480 RepID=A0AA86S7E6_9FABA|nr:unnamed protein product [Sphenostylis stenocarpa]